jgi:uncharacterized cupredoxin-like copper-binding protein
LIQVNTLAASTAFSSAVQPKESSMKNSVRSALAAILLLAPAAAPGISAEGQTTVKVALLDMSALMPMGMSGYGMMGPGMMMGQGMMGQGMTGQGMMGQGMMGAPGMMGQGMMGGMMMAMMAVRIDQPSVKAGTVTFDVTNWSTSVLHEMLIVSVTSPTAPLPYDYMQAKVPEEQVKVLGEVEDLQPNASKSFEAALSPGYYLLICNVPGHYAAGMAAPLSVTP